MTVRRDAETPIRTPISGVITRAALLAALVLFGTLINGCAQGAAGPGADAQRTLEDVAETAADLDRASLETAIRDYKAAIREETDPDRARRLKDRLKVYTDERTRRDQK